MIINLSKNIPYYTQRNNRFYPHGTCNTTAMVQALEASGLHFEYPQDMQPEDYLTQILDSQEAWDIMRSRYPWAIAGGYSPRHVHHMLVWAVNDKLFGRKVVEYKCISTQKIILSLLKGHAVVVAGRFTKFGHIVAVVGFETSQEDITANSAPEYIDLLKISRIIIDDPYGNYHTGYKNVNGNDTPYTIQQFDWVVKEYNNLQKKWAHVFEGVV